jgi:membrane protease YdiL (CAAX protease family)
MPEARQMKLPAAAGVWALVCFVGALAGTWRGYGGRALAVALAAFAALFAVQVLFAAQGVAEQFVAQIAELRGIVWLSPCLVYLGYMLGTGTFGWARVGIILAYALAPTALLMSAGSRTKGCWQDYAAVLCIWLPAELHVLQRAFPYPARGLAHPLWESYAITVGLIAFLVVRGLDGVGYRVAWGRGWSWTVALHFGWFAFVAIVLGQAIGFIRFAPSFERLKALPLTALGILLFNAWPEEFLFRGLLQNLLSTSLRSELAGLLAAAVIFGLAHLNNGPFPNWRYALLAGIAGLAYGSAWRKTRCIFASALVHTGINVMWYALFPTVAR